MQQYSCPSRRGPGAAWGSETLVPAGPIERHDMSPHSYIGRRAIQAVNRASARPGNPRQPCRAWQMPVARFSPYSVADSPWQDNRIQCDNRCHRKVSCCALHQRRAACLIEVRPTPTSGPERGDADRRAAGAIVATCAGSHASVAAMPSATASPMCAPRAWATATPRTNCAGCCERRGSAA